MSRNGFNRRCTFLKHGDSDAEVRPEQQRPESAFVAYVSKYCPDVFNLMESYKRSHETHTEFLYYNILITHAQAFAYDDTKYLIGMNTLI